MSQISWRIVCASLVCCAPTSSLFRVSKRLEWWHICWSFADLAPGNSGNRKIFVAPLTMSTLIQKLAVFIFWPLEHAHVIGHVLSVRHAAVTQYMWHVTCLHWDFSISFFLLRGIWGNRYERDEGGQAYSRLPNDLCYSPSMYYPWCLSCHVYCRTWRHPPPPPPAWQSRVTEPHDEMPGTQWRRHDHRVRHGNCGGEIL